MYVRPQPDNSFDKYDEYRLHMEALLSAPLVFLDLPLRVAIPLDKVGIRLLSDIVPLTREDLLKIDRIGVGAVEIIERILDRYDLSLGMK